MKGLILKDLLILKNQAKSIFVAFIIYTGIICMQQNFQMLAFIAPFLVITLILTTFSYDDYNHWNTYCSTLPYSRKDIVKSKYLLVLLLSVFAIIFGILTTVITMIFGTESNLGESLAYVGGTIFGSTMMLSLLMPFIYKFGVQKGRIILVITMMTFISLITGFLSLFRFNFAGINTFFTNLGAIPIAIVAVLLMAGMLYLSYAASSKVYSKKEF